jgi:nucleoside-diphosphate-sugar epimerase
MDVVVAGGHGQIALRLIELLSRGGHGARGIIRNPDQAADLEARGGTAIVCDLEHEDLDPSVLDGADAVVFAAGAGPGSGPERKRTVDYGACVKCADAAVAAGVRRFVVISSIGAQAPEQASESMRPYTQAKADADAYVMGQDALDWTIVRPGQLTDEPGDGLVDVSTELGRRAPVTRDDVAAVLAVALVTPNTVGKVFEVFDGDVPVADALAAL